MDSSPQNVDINVAQAYLNTQDKIGDNLNGGANDSQGQSISYNEDASIMVVGADKHDGNKGTARVFELKSGNWEQLGLDLDGSASNDNQGYAVAVSSDGNVVAVGANGHDNNKGTVRVYKLSASKVWEQVGGDIDGRKTNDYHGSSISFSKDGNTLAIGAFGHDNNKGSVRVFQFGSDNWDQMGSDIDGVAAGDFHGKSISLSGDGLTLAVGALSLIHI